jgi:hypothetical protein
MPDLTYFSPKVAKRLSPIDGRGLFATAAVSKGEVVVVKGGSILTRDQRDRIGEALGPSEVQITGDLFIGPCALSERAGGMMQLNHSCERIWDCKVRLSLLPSGISLLARS